MSGEHTTRSARIEIEGPDGFVLRQFVPEDSQTIFDVMHTDTERIEEFEPGMLDTYKTPEDVRKSIEEPENTDKLRFGIWNGDEMVGSINLTPNEDKPDEAEVGYWVGGDHYGNHYAQRATKLLIDYAFNQMKMERLVATTNIKNNASAKTLERSGFRFVVLAPDEKTWLYELTKEDYSRVLLS